MTAGNLEFVKKRERELYLTLMIRPSIEISIECIIIYLHDGKIKFIGENSGALMNHLIFTTLICLTRCIYLEIFRDF